MNNYNNIFEISEETVAAWLDGNLSEEEDLAFVEIISSDFQLAEILNEYEDIESDFEHLIEVGYEIPAELSFDFQLPDVYVETEGEIYDHNLGVSNFFPAWTEDSDIHESNEDVIESDEFSEESYGTQSDEMDSFL